MDKATRETLVRTALAEAKKAASEGNSPFGAVICDVDGRIIAAARNTVNADSDPTAHAEMNAIRAASKKLRTKDLSGFFLVSNVQSCPMCFSAAVRSRITDFIFGCAEDETLVPAVNVFKMSEFCKDVRIETGILENECRKFLNQQRNKQEPI